MKLSQKIIFKLKKIKNTLTMSSTPLLMPFQELPFNGDSFICKEFLRLKDELGLTMAVETGSCLYSTTKWLGENFDKVLTVDNNAAFTVHGQHKIADMENVIASIDDSVTFLLSVVKNFDKTDRVIYFLDAHWGEHCPLLDELKALTLSQTELPPVIAIHDWYTGNEAFGWDEYKGQRFDYEWIEPIIKQLEEANNCTYTHHYNTEAENGMRGIIYLVPKKSWVNELPKIEKWNKYSQSGEEAYISFIIENISPSISENKDTTDKKHLVELGAWDGFHLSNTRFLIEEGYTHLLIDGDNRGNKDVQEHFVTKDNILGILDASDTPKEFDLLCIDIDGNDLYVLEQILTEYAPSLIVAEFNPIWQPDESKVIAYDQDHTWSNDDYYGFSFAAGIKMAEKYGYVCVHQNDNLNMYFVRKELLGDIVVPTVTYTPTNYHPKSEKNNWVNY
jgi:hypothetical protein